jgi:hypothetical protein
MIWLIHGAGPVEIRANLGLAAGAFTLGAKIASGAEVAVNRLDVAGEADGDAQFAATIAETSVFRLQIVPAFVSGEQTATLQVLKNGVVVRCEDDLENVLNQKGGGYGSVELGKVKLNEPIVTLFRVRP